MRYYYEEPILKTIFVLDEEVDHPSLDYIGKSQNPNHKMAASKMLPRKSGYKFSFSFSVVSESAQSSNED